MAIAKLAVGIAHKSKPLINNKRVTHQSLLTSTFEILSSFVLKNSDRPNSKVISKLKVPILTALIPLSSTKNQYFNPSSVSHQFRFPSPYRSIKKNKLST
jgi:hypothetical protein